MISYIKIETAANDKMCNFRIVKLLYVAYGSDPSYLKFYFILVSHYLTQACTLLIPLAVYV